MLDVVDRAGAESRIAAKLLPAFLQRQAKLGDARRCRPLGGQTVGVEVSGPIEATLPHAGATPGNSRETPPDPLQQRRAALIWHYDFHGYPERARYLERMDQGPELLAFLQAEKPGAIDDLLAWWTGSSPGRTERLRRAMDQLTIATARAMDTTGPQLGVNHRQRQHDMARESAKPLLEDALNAGLVARVNTKLSPFGAPSTADHVAYMFLHVWRELSCGSKLAAQAPLPSIPLPGGGTAHLVCCEWCSLVALQSRPARRCHWCDKRTARPSGAIAIPHTLIEAIENASRLGLSGSPASSATLSEIATRPDTGHRTAFLHTCIVCGLAFLGRADAQTCSGKCRIALTRSA